MSNFEKITETPEAMGAFLESLTVINSPWEDGFHKAFCGTCGKTDCGICPHQDKRNNPLWWLKLGEKPGVALSLSIRIKETPTCGAGSITPWQRRRRKSGRLAPAVTTPVK